MTICMEKDCNNVLNPINHEYMYCMACEYKRAIKWMDRHFPNWDKEKKGEHMSLKYSMEFFRLSKEKVKMEVHHNYRVMAEVLSEELNLPINGMMFTALLDFFSFRMGILGLSNLEKHKLMVKVFGEISERICNGEE